METIENIKSNHLHLGKKIERVRRLRGMTQTELGPIIRNNQAGCFKNGTNREN